MPDKKDLRNNLFSQAIALDKRLIEINGEKYEIRQPTIAQRNEITIRCQQGDHIIDGLAYQLWGVIMFTYNPDTNERVFEDTDYEQLANMPTGSFVDVIAQSILEVSNVDISEAKKP